MEYRVIGLMSGTSLDGLDVAYVHFYKKSEHWQYELLDQETVAYPISIINPLKGVLNSSGESLMALDVKLGLFYGQIVEEFISTRKLHVDFISSHGHTVFHNVDERYTTQIGNPLCIKYLTGLPVVANFRTQDVIKGGQGAPLVPIGDRLLFQDYLYCLNLGGISNISFEKNGERLAMDCGLANMVLNDITQQIHKPYDEGGAMARAGTLIPDLLHALNALPYYGQAPPKSLGAEWYVKNVKPILSVYDDYRIEDILHTCVHHNCQQIVNHIDQYGAQEKGEILVTGGGAFNTFFVDTLKTYLSDGLSLVIPDDHLISYKEAIVFAFLGVLKMQGEINVLSSVTGAESDSSSGIIH